MGLMIFNDSHSNFNFFSGSGKPFLVLKTVLFGMKLGLKPCSIDVSRNFLSNALVNVSNGRLEPELWHVQLIDRIGVILTINLAMSVLIDKSVCPHASGQQTAMHVCAGVRVGVSGCSVWCGVV